MLPVWMSMLLCGHGLTCAFFGFDALGVAMKDVFKDIIVKKKKKLQALLKETFLEDDDSTLIISSHVKSFVGRKGYSVDLLFELLTELCTGADAMLKVVQGDAKEPGSAKFGLSDAYCAEQARLREEQAERDRQVARGYADAMTPHIISAFTYMYPDCPAQLEREEKFFRACDDRCDPFTHCCAFVDHVCASNWRPMVRWSACDSCFYQTFGF